MIEPADLQNQAISPETLRRRGRPRVVEGPAEQIPRVLLPTPVYDALCRAAVRRGESVTDAIRRALQRYARDF